MIRQEPLSKASNGRNYSRYWRQDIIAVLIILIAGSLLCRAFALDETVAKWFYHPPGLSAAWPYGRLQPWRFFNHADKLFTLLLSAIALGALSLSFLISRAGIWRRRALFIIVSMLIGPGLIVNICLKDHWGRPRPEQVKEFGGQLDFKPLFVKGTGGQGHSFPSGHASIAFEFLVFYFIWRRCRLRAFTALAGGLGLGLMMSVARMAAGAHFLSDVLWSGGITFIVSWVLYYFVFRIPEHEDSRSSNDRV
ncbi:phosphatase PAP2 family protein [Desulfobacterota bacterium M19]